MPRPTLAERFTARTVPGENGCVLWTGPVSASGHPLTHDFGLISARAVAWRLHRGRRPQRAMVVVTTCGDRLCVAGDHLRLARKATILRQNAPQLVANRRKRRCPAGHPYDEENTYVDRHGQRYCRTCHRDRERRRYQARKSG